MSIDSKHPEYSRILPDWGVMRVTFAGERVVKETGIEHLPPTAGQIADGMTAISDPGFQSYIAYKMRARFPDLVKNSVKSLLGVMHREPPTILLPEKLEYLRDQATLEGDSLPMLLRRINEQQLVPGRLGLLGDVIDEGSRTGDFYVAMYEAEACINWDATSRDKAGNQTLNLVVLDESGVERSTDGFEWDTVDKFRVLQLGELLGDNAEGTYTAGLFVDTLSFDEATMVEPMVKGAKPTEIPFVFINGQDVTPDPQDPPLLGLASLCLAIYRGEADYRQSLFLQGQDTLVVIGAAEGTEFRVGAGAAIVLPSVGSDAKFIGVDSTGLEEQRKSLENDYARGEASTGQLLDTTSREKESGSALRTRVGVRTATLNEIAMAGAFGLQRLLRKLAKWVGADPEEVIVTPNLDFVADQMSGDELGAFMGAKSMGAPISFETIHTQMQERNVTDKTFDEELEQINKETEDGILTDIAAGSTNPDGPEDDDDGDDGDGDGDGGDPDADKGKKQVGKVV